MKFSQTTAIVCFAFLTMAGCVPARADDLLSDVTGPRIVYKGVFIGDTTIAGEQKRDWLQPSHPYCWQLSRLRWMWVFQTRGFSGIDAEHSILYQIRSGSPDGAILKEGRLAKFRDDWDPFQDGSKYWKIHGHPKVFGVPRGALSQTRKPLSHHNVFVAAWYTRARAVVDGKLLDPHTDTKLENTQHLEWVQFRLNSSGDDIQLLTKPVMLRQQGYESGEAICSLSPRRMRMNHWAHPPEPLDGDYTRWLDTPHFNNNGIAAIEYRFNPATRLYEWTRTGSIVKSEPGKGKFFEGSINRLGKEWVLCVRNRGHVLDGHRGSCTAWFRIPDPFTGWGRPTYAPTPSSYCPRTAWMMADGVLRIFSGDFAESPHRQKRDPLFCWDVNPDEFSVTNVRTILDARRTLKMELPMVGFAKLSPVHNNRQLLTFRVTTQNHRQATDRWPAVTKQDLEQAGAHYCEIIYDRDVPDAWRFAESER